MITAERRKADIIKSISLNPTEITIKQVNKTIEDGAFKEEEKESILTVRIYHQQRNDIQISSNTIGTVYKSKGYGMLVDSTADLQVNPKSAIEFECMCGHMKILAVHPQVIKGELCGYQVDLEKIS